jgi:hypothetical protein
LLPCLSASHSPSFLLLILYFLHPCHGNWYE